MAKHNLIRPQGPTFLKSVAPSFKGPKRLNSKGKVTHHSLRQNTSEPNPIPTEVMQLRQQLLNSRSEATQTIVNNIGR